MPNLPLPCPNNRSCFTAIIMDAGQGDATLLVFPDNSLILVDCGSKKNSGVVVDEIAKVLEAYLGRTGNYLKALILTHPDEDHYNLVDELIIRNTKLQIGCVYFGGSHLQYGSRVGDWLLYHFDPDYSPRQIEEVVDMPESFSSLWADPYLSYDGRGAAPDVDVRILAANVGRDKNARSIVLLVTYLDVNLFLMGDATKQTENHILNNVPLTDLLRRRRTVLKAGHHGSNTSTTRRWLAKIEPKFVFISSDTQEFGQYKSSLPRSAVIDGIFEQQSLYAAAPGHYYVQFNDDTEVHEDIYTTDALMTTLHRLKFKNETDFKAYGTSWYYTVVGKKKGQTFVADDVLYGPAADWDYINKPWS
jgi:beta-lactamase superfamily II metal-dependent hydrolase